MPTTEILVSPGLWTLAWRRLRADRSAMLSMTIVLLFLLAVALSSSGLLAADWEREVGVSYAPPSFVGAQRADERVSGAPKDGAEALPENPFDPLRDVIRQLRKESAAGQSLLPGRRETLPFGADKWGHDIVKKTIKGGETSMMVGLAAAMMATLLGTILGAVSGYFGKAVDDFCNWFYSIFTSIPNMLLIMAVAAVVQHRGVATIVLILGLTGWTGTYRLIRAEYLKHKTREYVLAADAIGASHWSKMVSHIFPNVSHVALVQMSILSVGFIKAEVILSFLGFGVPVGVVSWGSMLNEAQNELILGKWWQLTAASIAMAVLVTAFSLFTDALRDALDPKLKALA